MLIKKTIKYLLNTVGYEVKKKQPNPLIQNYFGANYTKKTLISYITAPFTAGIKLNHTNFAECFQIAKIFNSLGYNVDIINFNDETTKIDYTKYDVIFGFGDPLEKSFYSNEINKRITVFYGTGCHSDFQNKATVDRLYDVFCKKGVYMPKSARIVDKTWILQKTFSTGIISLGNNFVKNTYQKHYKGKSRVIAVPASFYKTYNINLDKKNYMEAKKHFLWFGSSGLIHKGLDILLDIFKNKKDVILHVCGNINNEKPFNKVYYKQLFNTPNIIDHGFVDLRSDSFIQIMNTCGFVLFPSASEGGSPSVLTAMGNGGLIPIISKAGGLDVEKFGFIFDDLQEETVELFIENALQLSNEEMYKKSKQSLEFANKQHSFKNYSDKMEQAIRKQII